MSDDPISGNHHDNTMIELRYWMGKIDTTLSNIVTSLAETKAEHTIFVGKVAAEHADIKLSILSGDAHNALRIDTLKNELVKRIDDVEDQAATVTTSYRVVKVVAGAMVVVLGGVFALVQWVVPLLHLGATVTGH